MLLTQMETFYLSYFYVCCLDKDNGAVMKYCYDVVVVGAGPAEFYSPELTKLTKI